MELYVELPDKYLAEAEELYARCDLVQAGENCWGAVAALLNAVAEKRGMPHYHRDYAVLIDQLYEEQATRSKKSSPQPRGYAPILTTSWAENSSKPIELQY